MMKNGFKHSQARGFYEGFFSCRPGRVSLDHQRLSEADPLLELQTIQTTWDCKTIWNLCRFPKKPSAASGWPILNTLADPSLPEVWRRRRALHLKPRRPRPEALRKPWPKPLANVERHTVKLLSQLTWQQKMVTATWLFSAKSSRPWTAIYGGSSTGASRSPACPAFSSLPGASLEWLKSSFRVKNTKGIRGPRSSRPCGGSVRRSADSACWCWNVAHGSYRPCCTLTPRGLHSCPAVGVISFESFVNGLARSWILRRAHRLTMDPTHANILFQWPGNCSHSTKHRIRWSRQRWLLHWFLYQGCSDLIISRTIGNQILQMELKPQIVAPPLSPPWNTKNSPASSPALHPNPVPMARGARAQTTHRSGGTLSAIKAFFFGAGHQREDAADAWTQHAAGGRITLPLPLRIRPKQVSEVSVSVTTAHLFMPRQQFSEAIRANHSHQLQQNLKRHHRPCPLIANPWVRSPFRCVDLCYMTNVFAMLLWQKVLVLQSPRSDTRSLLRWQSRQKANIQAQIIPQSIIWAYSTSSRETFPEKGSAKLPSLHSSPSSKSGLHPKRAPPKEPTNTGQKLSGPANLGVDASVAQNWSK